MTGRLLASAKDVNDPRLNYTREFYGTLDGENVTGWDTYYGSARTSDRSHLWHIHISFLRKYVNDSVAMNAVLSVIKGQTVLQWQAGNGGDMDYSAREIVNSVVNGSIDKGYLTGQETRENGQTGWDVITARSFNLRVICAKLDAIAAKVGAPVTVSLSAEQQATIANTVAQRVIENVNSPLGDADKPTIVAAVKQALSEGTH